MPKPQAFRSKGRGKDRIVYPLTGRAAQKAGRNFKLKAKVSQTEVAIPIEMGKTGRKGMASWTKKAAEGIARKVRPLVGKRVLLYGGGGMGVDVAELKGVKVEPVTLYGRIVKGKRQDFRKPRKSKTEFFVTVDLYDPKGRLGRGTKQFTPHLGSWKLAKISSPKLSPQTKRRWKRLGFTKAQVDEAEYRGIDLETDIGA